jgi:hypothetical protein
MDQTRRADLVERGELVVVQRELGGAQVVLELVVPASADHQGADAGLAQQIGERDLGGRDAAAVGDADQHLDDVVKPLPVADRRLTSAGHRCVAVAGSDSGVLPTRPAGRLRRC